MTEGPRNPMRMVIRANGLWWSGLLALAAFLGPGADEALSTSAAHTRWFQVSRKTKTGDPSTNTAVAPAAAWQEKSSLNCGQLMHNISLSLKWSILRRRAATEPY
jgi:hypothetical protein